MQIHILRNQILSLMAMLDEMREVVLLKRPGVSVQELQRLIDWLNMHLKKIEKGIEQGRTRWSFGVGYECQEILMMEYLKECSEEIAWKRTAPLWDIVYDVDLFAKEQGLRFDSEYYFEFVE